MEKFIPRRVLFEQQALEYQLGKELYDYFRATSIPVTMIGSHNRVTGIPGKSPLEKYVEAKRTLVIGVRKGIDFAACKPSAHYQLPLQTSCPSMCEYCYLQTTLGKKPYLRIYVNIEEILAKCQQYIEERKPEITYFEGAATSDPIPLEYLTGILHKTIEFFAGQEYGRFRFVTKHIGVDSLLTANHNKHTRFRFSLNAAPVIERFEHATPGMLKRVEAAGKVARAGYPVGFIIAPIIVFPGWQEQYQQLVVSLHEALPEEAQEDLTFELITHRFTTRAKNNILSLYPETTLPMDENERKLKYGQFGYVKYVYKPEIMQDVKAFMLEQLQRYFPKAKTDYFI